MTSQLAQARLTNFQGRPLKQVSQHGKSDATLQPPGGRGVGMALECTTRALLSDCECPGRGWETFPMIWPEEKWHDQGSNQKKKNYHPAARTGNKTHRCGGGEGLRGLGMGPLGLNDGLHRPQCSENPPHNRTQCNKPGKLSPDMPAKYKVPSWARHFPRGSHGWSCAVLVCWTAAPWGTSAGSAP